MGDSKCCGRWVACGTLASFPTLAKRRIKKLSYAKIYNFLYIIIYSSCLES